MSTKSRINRYNFWIALYVFVSLLELVGVVFSEGFDKCYKAVTDADPNCLRFSEYEI